nr:basic proline-rich protein-like [Meriones unguiculatus]
MLGVRGLQPILSVGGCPRFSQRGIPQPLAWAGAERGGRPGPRVVGGARGGPGRPAPSPAARPGRRRSVPFAALCRFPRPQEAVQAPGGRAPGVYGPPRLAAHGARQGQRVTGPGEPPSQGRAAGGSSVPAPPPLRRGPRPPQPRQHTGRRRGGIRPDPPLPQTSAPRSAEPPSRAPPPGPPAPARAQESVPPPAAARRPRDPPPAPPRAAAARSSPPARALPAKPMM